MLRVNPEARRHYETCKDSKPPNNYRVVNGTIDEIRPEILLFTILNNINILYYIIEKFTQIKNRTMDYEDSDYITIY